jgi:flagellar export protein FliJ
MANPFAFRLERLLEVRRLQENVAQRELAAAHQAVDERNGIILDLMTREDDAKEERRSLQKQSIDMSRLRLSDDFLASLGRLLQKEYLLLQDLVKAEMEKREKLTEARKGVRVLEKFRERERQAHLRGLDLQERKDLDEIGQNIAKGA